MAKEKTKVFTINELDAAKMEKMRIRFRRVLGEGVSAHVIKNTRKNIAKCVRLLESRGEKNA